MSELRPLSYSLVELHSYLPAGWNLMDPGDSGHWDAAKGSWVVEVHDGADMPWTVRVRTADAAKNGRLEALRQALDFVYRTGVGKDGLFG